MGKRNRHILLIGAALLIVAGLSFHFYVVSKVSKLTNISIEFGKATEKVERRETKNLVTAKTVSDDWYQTASTYQPFAEIVPFDEDAKDWSTFFDGYGAAGVLVFDANNDGLEDVYLCHNNSSWARPTDDHAILQEEPRISGNGLYINLGNNAEEHPIFKQAKELTMKNRTFVKEELLIEDLFFPRENPEGPIGQGRISASAISVDLNNDGRLDLVVANLLPGMLWSDEKTQRILGQFVRPVGRQAVNSKIPLSAMGVHLLKDYQAINDTESTHETSRGTEFVGANSVYLNMGDKDHDGLPEWKDVSRETGLEGKRSTQSVMAADIDLDGDLDIFEANIMDEDFWPGGSNTLAGACNQLYINQLAETGELKFIERAEQMEVDGMYDDNNDIPDYYRMHRYTFLPEMYSIGLHQFEAYKPEFLEIHGSESERAQISWASVFQDVNDDGYPDIWVANDLGFLRLYINEYGKKFSQAEHCRSHQSGYWMSLSPADFNGDLKEDLFAGNMGGASMNLAIPVPDPYSLFDPVMTTATLTQQIFDKKHNSMHALIDGSNPTAEFKSKVRHSSLLPPDASLPNNIRDFIEGGAGVEYDPSSLDPYEFTWGSTTIDVQNDGRQDLYWVGCLYGRGGGIFPIMGTGPGRLLVNVTEQADQLEFIDLTAEHHLFNIQELNYDRLVSDGYVYRDSPRQNWGKRSIVNSYDVSTWGFQGPDIIEKITNQDLIQTAENGRAAVAADLNGDGFSDIIVRNKGGYDSRGSDSRNLQAIIKGRPQVIPAHDPNFPSPTNFEAGSTRVFINNYASNNWLKVELIDETPGSFNRDGIGSKIVLNDKQVQVIRSGNGGFVSNRFDKALFGMGAERALSIKVHWPDKQRTVDTFELDGLTNGTITIRKGNEEFDWKPQGEFVAQASERQKKDEL